MPNAMYREMGDGSYLNQACPGGPIKLMVQLNPNAPNALTAWQIAATWDLVSILFMSGTGFAGQATAALQQSQLDTYVAAINAGTA